MAGRISARVAWSVCGVTVALVVGAVSLGVLNRVVAAYQLYLVFVVSCALVGGFVAAHRPANPVGWLLAGSALSFALLEVTGEYALCGLVTHPGSLPAAWAVAWPQTWLQVPAVMLVFAFLPLYFPDGRLPSPGWRWVAHALIVVSVVAAVLFALLPGSVGAAAGGSRGITNPLGIAALRPLALASPLPFLLMICVAAASLVVRFRRSHGEERQQVKWLTCATLALLVALIIDKAYPPADPVTVLILPAIPAAIGIAVLWYRLYAIDLIINRTLVYGALSGIVVGLYLLVVGGLGDLLASHANLLLSLLATGLVKSGHEVALVQEVGRLEQGVSLSDNGGDWETLLWVGHHGRS